LLKYYYQFIIILFVVTNKFSAQTFKKIGVEDGLPSSIVYDIKVDKQNRIWIATFGGGIACYDGIKFNSINSDMGLNNDLIRNIALDEKNGTIYVGSQGAFELITRDSIININKILNDSFPSNVVLTAIIGNTVYASTQDGFITIVNNKRVSVFKKVLPNPNCFLIDDDKNHWLPNRYRLVIKLANGTLVDYKKDFNINIEGITDIKKYKKYTLLATKNGLYIFDKLNLVEAQEFVHFGLTSQDINNTAIPLSIKEALTDVIIPNINLVLDKILEQAKEWEEIPMLAKTHGQAASPTKLGKEWMVFASRIKEQLNQLNNIPNFFHNLLLYLLEPLKN
jgi:hypothetical protein